jgi:hypothetical protein
MIDFLKLAEQAYGKNATVDDKNKLFEAFFNLKDVIVAKDPDEKGIAPLQRVIDKKICIFAFTSHGLLQHFEQVNNLAKNGPSPYFIMPMKGFIQWTMGMKNSTIDLVQFNFSSGGWFSPPGQIEIIYKHIRK